MVLGYHIFQLIVMWSTAPATKHVSPERAPGPRQAYVGLQYAMAMVCVAGPENKPLYNR